MDCGWLYHLEQLPVFAEDDLAEATQDSTTISSQTVQGLTDKEVNYMRNSVKATVDAYDGSVVSTPGMTPIRCSRRGRASSRANTTR